MEAWLVTKQFMGYFMADKKHRNPIRIATTTQEREADAISEVLTRELLYNRNNKTLGIVLEDEDGNKYRQIVSGLVDEVNITKNENYETKLKEDIIIDSVTTQADHKGVDWKSQYKIAETTSERTVILLCKQDTDLETDMGVIGGEVLEVGAGVFGHYQISLTSTGSRLIKGATTFDKKARLVLAKYNGTYYYGIKFKSAAPANIYFAGWSKIPAGLSAPLYTTYNDGALSEVIELDDDSDTGTEVVDFEFLTYDDFTWEFFTAPYIKTTESSSAQYQSNQSTLTRRTDFLGVGTTHFGTGYAHNQRYYGLHWYDSVDYTYNGKTIDASNTIRFGTDTRGRYVQLSGEGIAGYVSVPGNDKGTVGFNVYNNTNTEINIKLTKILSDRHIGSDVAQVTIPAYTRQWAMFSDLSAGEYYFHQSGSVRYYEESISYNTVTETIRDANWNQDGDNNGYSLTNGLSITSSKATSWYEGTQANNSGYIDFAEAGRQSDPAMTLNVLGKASVKVGFTSINGNNTNIRISETLDTSDEKWRSSVSVDNPRTTSIKECVYDYNNDDTGKVYIMNEVGPVRILYVEIDYDENVSNGLEIAEVIQGLPDTGEDGSPHIIRLSGEITKEAILKIAESLRESTRQVILDCSKCVMEAQYVDWTADTDLHGAFANCVSLREFYYPMNVTSSGGNTFKNCSFLRKVVFNNELKRVGGDDQVWSWENNAMFAGARIKTIFIPKSVNKFGGYPFSYSNIVNLFIEEGSAILTSSNSTAFGQWNTWVAVKEPLRFRVPQSIYDVVKNVNTTFQGYGADGDGVNTIGPSCRISDHIALWDGDYESIDYTARYEVE